MEAEKTHTVVLNVGDNLRDFDEAQHATPASPRPRLGAVSFLHRFGSGLNRRAHLHAALTDGVFLPGPHGPDGPPDSLRRRREGGAAG